MANIRKDEEEGGQSHQSTDEKLWICRWYNSSRWNFVCFLIFSLCAINAIVTWCKYSMGNKPKEENKAGNKDETTQFTFLLCVIVVGLQTVLLLIYKIWKLQNTSAKVAILTLFGGTFFVIATSYIIYFSSDKYRIYALLCQGPLLTFVIGIMAFFPLQSREEADNELSEKMKVVKTEIVKLDKEKKDLISQNDELRKANTASIKALDQMETLQNAYNEIFDKANTVEEENRNLEKIKKDLESNELQKDKIASNEVLNQATTLQAAKNDFSQQIRVVESEKTNLVKDIEELRSKNRGLIEDIDASNKQIGVQNVEMEKMEEQVVRMRGELEVLNELQTSQKTRMEELLKRSVVMVEVNNHLLIERRQLRGNVINTHKNCNELQRKLAFISRRSFECIW